jgi:hypothetical protein
MQMRMAQMLQKYCRQCLDTLVLMLLLPQFYAASHEDTAQTKFFEQK